MTQPAWWEEVLSLSHSAYLHISREQRIIDALGTPRRCWPATHQR